VLTRSSDADVASELEEGSFCWVKGGTANANTRWAVSSEPTTINVEVIAFTQISGAAELTAGAGLTKTGNTIDAVAGAGIVVGADSVSADFSAASAASGAANTVEVGDAFAVGVSAKVAREDHQHALPAPAAPADIGLAAAAGSSLNVARQDHVHVHPSLAGDLHPEYIRVGGGRDFTASQKFAGQRLTIQNLTANGNISATADYIRLSGAAAVCAGTLPSATGSGQVYYIRALSVTNAVSVAPQAGDAIDFAANGVSKSLLVAGEGYSFIDAAANKWETV
jgi:hypothetical protein